MEMENEQSAQKCIENLHKKGAIKWVAKRNQKKVQKKYIKKNKIKYN